MIKRSRLGARTIFALFASLVLLGASAPAGAQSRPTIVLDAGHGGFDRGGVPGQRISEKDKTLDVALRVKANLEDAGYRVVLTRASDVFVTLGQRVAIANSFRNATFISIHFNCAPRSGANGIETYYYHADSAALAASIHRNVVATATSENRGIRRRGFFVLRRTAIPAVLIECGFLTNPTEGALAQSATYRQRLANAITRGIQREPASISRPLARSASVSAEVLPQPFNGGDFVRAAPASERARARRATHHKKSARHQHSTKKSSSSAQKKKKKKAAADNQ